MYDAMSAPGISILIAVRNGERFIDAALSSLARQSYKNFEIILVDNGSCDGTSGIIDAWTQREPRLRAFRHQRVGLAGSLNYAASMACAPLLARLDADDLALPTRLDAQRAWMRQNPRVGVAGSFANLIDTKGRVLGIVRHPVGDADIRRSLRSGCPFVHSSVIMRRSAFEAAGGYREGLRVSEDFDLWTRMAEAAELANVPEVLVAYRVHARSMSSRQPARMAVASACVIAAREARQRCVAEPFREGRPRLRKALALMDHPRSDFARELRIQLMRAQVDMFYLRLPFPPVFKHRLRQWAVQVGLKRGYNALLRRL
jgi:glycosyltransferase involved in cell wall biosynthesis